MTQISINAEKFEELNDSQKERVLEKVQQIEQSQQLYGEMIQVNDFCFKKCFTKIKSSKGKI